MLNPFLGLFTKPKSKKKDTYTGTVLFRDRSKLEVINVTLDQIKNVDLGTETFHFHTREGIVSVRGEDIAKITHVKNET
jgi:hypothetical protein